MPKTGSIAGARSSVALGVCEPRGNLKLVHQAFGDPKPGWVRVAVHATSVCHADLGTMSATESRYGFPIIPGHEIAGTISAIGADVTGFELHERVVIGWFGGSCQVCAHCRRGDVVYCRDRKVTGVSFAGGWAENLEVPATAIAKVPDGLDLIDAAPFGCAGVATFNAVRRTGARDGGLVAVFGLGGLGHLALQFAQRMGYQTVAIARGEEKESAALDLGAHHYIDASAQKPGAALRAMGGADLVVFTASSTEPIPELLPGVAPRGKLALLGTDQKEIALSASELVSRGQTIIGSVPGSPTEVEEAMKFAVTTGVRAKCHVVPFRSAEGALTEMRLGKARFRILLSLGKVGDPV
jgi:D-arabinose 1-dehydrogenase-like Zn-dependent alcohol dehydrogenase